MTAHGFSRSPLLLFLLFALCSFPYTLNAQYYSLGSDPASVIWKQVKTRHFTLIFPESLDSQAIHIANALEYFRTPGSASLGANPGKWPVILHSSSVISNATTPYAPKRIDMLTTPPQDNYGQDWSDQLVIHEFRHTVQYASVDKGFTKAMTYLFGQQAVPAVMGLFVPFWCIEGDAVVTETATTKTGRGRIPSFEMRLKAQVLEEGIYSYDKAYNGSYRDFTSDWYELGYQMVGNSRLKYGQDTWEKVMRKTGVIPLMLVPFSNTLYKETGYGKSRLYQSVFNELQDKWQAEDSSVSLTSFTQLTTSYTKSYTNYAQPVAQEDGRIIAVRSSIDDITRIVKIDPDGDEKVVLTPGTMIDGQLSGSNGMICWAELDNDPRWNLRDYSVIIVYDISCETTRQLTHRSRYFSPALSPDGNNIAAVEVDPENRNYIVILDAKTGEILQKFPSPENYFISYPAWSPDGKSLAVILTRSEGKALDIVDAQNGEFTTIVPFSDYEISKPAWGRHMIFYTASYTGRDNIFAVDQATGELFQVTSARFGATDAEISGDGNRLYYSNYSAKGYSIVSSSLEPETWNLKPETWSNKPHLFSLADSLSDQESFSFKNSEIPDSAYAVKPYRKGLNLFNFHSWAPLAADIDNTDANPGVTLLSQNLLGTSFTTLGYEYNLNEGTGKYFLKYSYEGLYPAFDLDLDYGLRHGVVNDSVHGQIDFDYHELNAGGWIRVPLGWNIRSWYAGFQPFAGYSLKYRKMKPGEEVEFKKDRFQSLNTRIYAYAQSRMSQRDIHPRWAQVIDLNFRHTLFEADTASFIFSAGMSLYFPGIFPHHSLKLYAGYQSRIANDYYYGDLINLPRGFSGIYTNEISTGSATYEFPICYPDWHIGPIIYIKRLKAALFYDCAIDKGVSPNEFYQSTGVDLTIDFHLFRLFTPLEAGLRTIYLPDSRRIALEFLYSVDLSY